MLDARTSHARGEVHRTVLDDLSCRELIGTPLPVFRSRWGIIITDCDICHAAGALNEPLICRGDISRAERASPHREPFQLACIDRQADQNSYVPSVRSAPGFFPRLSVVRAKRSVPGPIVHSSEGADPASCNRNLISSGSQGDSPCPRKQEPRVGRLCAARGMQSVAPTAYDRLCEAPSHLGWRI